jgi:hypothetical protein
LFDRSRPRGKRSDRSVARSDHWKALEPALPFDWNRCWYRSKRTNGDQELKRVLSVAPSDVRELFLGECLTRGHTWFGHREGIGMRRDSFVMRLLP